jgi:hypothetical protein
MRRWRWFSRFLAVLLLGISGMLAGNQLYGIVYEHACTPDVTCSAIIGTGSCASGANCVSTDTSSHFWACLPSTPDNCRDIASSTNCVGTCQDQTQANCPYTVGHCWPY